MNRDEKYFKSILRFTAFGGSLSFSLSIYQGTKASALQMPIEGRVMSRGVAAVAPWRGPFREGGPSMHASDSRSDGWGIIGRRIGMCQSGIGSSSCWLAGS